jgi:hypothetical protein
MYVFTALPAKAGTHSSKGWDNGGMVPAFAGMAL